MIKEKNFISISVFRDSHSNSVEKLIFIALKIDKMLSESASCVWLHLNAGKEYLLSVYRNGIKTLEYSKSQRWPEESSN